MLPAFSHSYNVQDPALPPLAAYIDAHAEEIVHLVSSAWESSILLFSQLTPEQRERIETLSQETLHVWARRLRQDADYASRVHELGREWGKQAAGWELFGSSLIKAISILIHATWDFLAENYPMYRLSPSTVFFLGKSRDQVLEDIQVPLLSVYTQRTEKELRVARFSLQGPLSLPGRALLLELANRLQAKLDTVMGGWMQSVREAPGSTQAMEQLLERRGSELAHLLVALLQSPTPETGAESLESMRTIGLESAQEGVSFQEMFHALQQLRPTLWETVYDIYRREQYWHPAEFIEVLARLHLLLDLFSEGIGQAYLYQKEMIIQGQAEELRRRDLQLAREMLESLLPARQVVIPHSEVAATWIPSSEIGGDFYDIFRLANGDIMIIIGDVSGKGVSASLLVGMVKYVIKANAPRYSSPTTLLTVANRLFYEDMSPELFVTLFAARYTPSTGSLVYTSAGHDPCYLYRAGRKSRLAKLSSQGPVLGVVPEVELRDRRLRMTAGDFLFLYTDGLVNVRYGDHMEPRELPEALASYEGLSAQEVVDRILGDIIDGYETTDDITIVTLKRVDTEGSAGE